MPDCGAWNRGEKDVVVLSTSNHGRPMNEESLFAAALERKPGPEREAFLGRACVGNPGLRRAVEELLQADSDAGSFLNHSPADGIATAASSDELKPSHWHGRAALPFLEPCNKPDRIGKLEHYEIIEVVGQGGMGVVLRAFDTKLSRVVAVKVMAPALAVHAVSVRRFLREATTAAAVHHEHVVTIHAVDDSHSPPYLVMEFIEGQTLQQKIERTGSLPLTQILRIGSQAAAGLAAAHKLGLIHRDVKPANILLENGVERVKITDFGLARAADDAQMTQTGIIAGTPQYMSPEQARGEPVDARSDLFSLGSVLYAMCSGRPAFRSEHPVAVLRRVCDDTPRPIAELRSDLPEWLIEIVAKLLQKRPEARFQSAQEVADLLAGFLAHVQQPASCPMPRRVVDRPRSDGEAAEATIRHENRWLWAAGILSVVASGLMTVVLARLWGNFPTRLVAMMMAGGILSLPVGLVIMYAAWQTESRASYSWALAGALLALLPLNPFLLFFLPITIWSLMTIQRAERDRLNAEGKPRKPLPPKAALGRPVQAAGVLVLLLMALGTAVLLLLPMAYFLVRARSQHEPAPAAAVEPVKRSDPVIDSDGWMSLFNGRDLTGWKAIPPQHWRVENGVLLGGGPDAFLLSDWDDFENFHLRVEFRINAEGDSGIHFRLPTPQRTAQRTAGPQWGYTFIGPEAEIGIRKSPGYRTGALSVKEPHSRVLAHAPPATHAAGEWATLELVADREHLQTLVNGTVINDYTDTERKFTQGHLALASWEDDKIKTVVEFRKIELKRLPR